MKLSKYKEDYYAFSGLASSSSRSLAMAGIALLWLFKSGEVAASYALPKELFIPATFLILSLLLDLLQYLFGSIIWEFFYEYHRKRGNLPDEEIEVEASKWYALPLKICFLGKVASNLVAYYLLLKFAFLHIQFK